MARNRMIRSEFWEDSKIHKLSAYARLLFIALWNFADDEGYLMHDCDWIKAKCFPYDKVNIAKLLDELLKLERIETRNGVLIIKNFLKYQRIEKPKKSELKEMFHRQVGEESGNSRGIVGEESPQEVKLREVKLREEKLKETEVNNTTNISDKDISKPIQQRGDESPHPSGGSPVNQKPQPNHTQWPQDDFQTVYEYCSSRGLTLSQAHINYLTPLTPDLRAQEIQNLLDVLKKQGRSVIRS